MIFRRRSRLWILCTLMLAVGLLAPALASGSEQGYERGSCNGVRLLSAPLIVIGQGNLIIDISRPINDAVHCQHVGLAAPASASARGGSHCKNAQVPGARLPRRLAAKAVRCLIDRERRQRGQRALKPRRSLKKAAKRHSRLMVGSGCFSHQCGGERDLVGRVTATSYLPCRCSWSVGETIAWGERARSTPKAIVAAWMASSPHRAVILNGALRDVDIGVSRGKPGSRRAPAATYTADFGYKR